MNAADYRDWRDRTSVFEGAALGNAPQNFNLIGSGEPERLLAGRLSSGLLPVLRVAPALGRGFTASEEQIGRGPRRDPGRRRCGGAGSARIRGFSAGPSI